MTVGEIIDELSKLPRDMQVVTMYDGFLFEIDYVHERRARKSEKMSSKWELDYKSEKVVVCLE